MDNAKQRTTTGQAEQLPDGVPDDFRAAWYRMAPTERAGRLIRLYSRLRERNAELDGKFEAWLQHNAMTALQTDALEELFDKSLDERGSPRTPASHPLGFEKDGDGVEHVVFGPRKTTGR